MEPAPMGALRERLQQAVYGFSQLAGCVCQGALVQVWLPVLNFRTGTCNDLQTKGQPWSISGSADAQLCLFRVACSELSCASTDDSATCRAVSHAMQQREVSVFADVRALPEGRYGRAVAAAAAGVRGCMLVPLFPHPDLSLAGPIAVLELAQCEIDVACFAPLFNWLLEKLPMLNLHIPSEIAHWYDAAGRDLVANTQPETPAAEQAAPAPAVAASDPARAASVERPSRSGPSRRHQQQQQQHVQQSLPRAVPTSSGRSLAEGCSGATVSLSTAPKMAAQAASDAKQPLIAAKAGIAGVESTARRDSLDTAASLRNSQISEAEHQAHDLASGPDADAAPEVHHRRAPLPDDTGEDSGESSGRAVQLSFSELKVHFGVPLTEAAAILGVQRQDLVRSCREHNMEGWPRLSMSVNEAACSSDIPATSLPSDVAAADMAAFVPFGPRAHRTTPASSWRTASVHTKPRQPTAAGGQAQQGGSGSRKPAAAASKEAAAACNSAVPSDHSRRLLEAGSPQEEGESNDWVGYAKGLMLPVQSPSPGRARWEGLEEAAPLLPCPAIADGSAQRQPQSSWHRMLEDDPFGDKMRECAERLRHSHSAESLAPLPAAAPLSGSACTGMSLDQCLGLPREPGISAADIAEAAALIGMAPSLGACQVLDQAPACLGSPAPITSAQTRVASAKAPEHMWAPAIREQSGRRQQEQEQQQPSHLATPQSQQSPLDQARAAETCRRALLGELDCAAEGAVTRAHPAAASAGRASGVSRMAPGICEAARAACREDPAAQAGAVPSPRLATSAAGAQRSLSGTTISDVSEATPPDVADTATKGAAERRKGQRILKKRKGRPAKKKRKAGRPSKKGHGAPKGQKVAVISGSQLGGRSRPRVKVRKAAPDAPPTTPAAERPATPKQSVAGRAPATEPHSQPADAEQAQAQEEAAAAVRGAEESQPAETATPQQSKLAGRPTVAEPAASQPLPGAGSEGSSSRGPQLRPYLSEPLLVAKAQDGPEITSSFMPLPNNGDDASQEQQGAEPEPMGAAMVPANEAGPAKQHTLATSASPAEPESQQQQQQHQLSAQLPAGERSSSRSQKKRAALEGADKPGQKRSADGSGSGGGERDAGVCPKKRGRPPQKIPHPLTGEMVLKRDLIAAGIDPKTGEPRMGRKRKQKSPSAGDEAPPKQLPKQLPKQSAPIPMLCRSDERKRPIKKSRRMLEAEEAQVLAVSEAEEEALKQGAAAGHEPAGGAAPDLAAEPAQRECLDTEARPADHDPKTPHTPTRGTSALLYMSTPTSRLRNVLLASPTARKFPADNNQEMMCDEQLPERLMESNEAALQGFLADALNFSPPRPLLPGISPFGKGALGGTFGAGGSLAGSPLMRLHEGDAQMFYGGPLGDLSTAFPDLADSSFSFGCFT